MIYHGGSADLHDVPVPVQRASSYICKTSAGGRSGRNVGEYIGEVIGRDNVLASGLVLLHEFYDLGCGWPIAR